MSKVILFEGSDMSGKTSILREYYNTSDKSDVLIDRGFISNSVFARLFGRDKKVAKDNEDNLEKVASALGKDFVLVLVRCEDAELRARDKDGEHSDIDLVKSSNMFYETITNNKNLSDHTVIIDTTNKTAQESAKELHELVDKLDKEEEK